MRTADEIWKARDAVVTALGTPGTSEQQRCILAGMSAALQWVAGLSGTVLEAMLDGKAITPGKVLPVPTLREADHREGQ